MENKFLLSLKYFMCLGLLFLVGSCMLRRPVASKTNQELFEVLKIDSISEAYIIYIKKTDLVFKVVSIKDEISGSCNKIVVSSDYDFELQSWINRPDRIQGHVQGLHIGGTAIGYIGEDIVQDLFYSKNLKGLCYSKTK